MAKSLRSKSRRRNEKAKREKYNGRAIDQLKKTLGLTRGYDKIRKAEIMRDVNEIKTAIEEHEKKIKALQELENADSNKEEVKPDTTDDVVAEVVEPEPPAKLKNGENPVWKSQRKIKAAKKTKKANKKKAKKIGKKAAEKAKN